MTPVLRTKAIYAAARAYFYVSCGAEAYECEWEEMDSGLLEYYIENMAAAIDALGPGFYVIPRWVTIDKIPRWVTTDKMLRANSELPHNSNLLTRFLAMAEAASLTRKS